MKFKDLIISNSWLSVEIIFINLYPDQKEIIEYYKIVFDRLQVMEAVNDEMLIVLTEYASDNDEDENYKSTYVDVAGRKLIADINSSFTDSYAIEFVKWDNWLGMSLAPETLENFKELEIISHCLHEMTFCGYEEEEIQQQFDSINKTIDDYKNLTDEEKKQQTIPLDEFKKKMDEKGDV
jgi:hypothetical protein